MKIFQCVIIDELSGIYNDHATLAMEDLVKDAHGGVIVDTDFARLRKNMVKSMTKEYIDSEFDIESEDLNELPEDEVEELFMGLIKSGVDWHQHGGLEDMRFYVNNGGLTGAIFDAGNYEARLKEWVRLPGYTTLIFYECYHSP